MTSPDRAAVLAAAAKRRHDQTVRKATQALRALDANGQPINFAAVARAAGVSRAWLYRYPTIRTEIDRLRRPRSPNPRPRRPADERASAESLRQQLDALHVLRDELRDENRRLREAVARKLGQQRAGLTDDIEPF
ncbi:MAG: DUF6262 family protein [Acidimicrobiales bacterium]